MKKTLLTTSLIAFAFGAFAQFTAGRLVVSQYGDGTNPLDANATAVFLKEFKVTGPVQTMATYTLALPTTLTGSNQPLTGNTTTANEGLITLSPNGTYLSAIGYQVNAGATLTGNNRTIGYITANGTINTTTVSTTSLGNPRCAITVDGTGFWIGSSSAGIRYIDLGTNGASTVIHNVTTSPAFSAVRSVNIFNGQLYETTNSSNGAHIGKITLSTTGEKLPKSNGGANTNTTPVAIPGTSNSIPTFPNQVVFLKKTVGAGEPDIFYVTNDDTGFIEKWAFNTSNSNWEPKGTVTATNVTGALSVKGITGRIIGDTVFVYANTAANVIAFRDTISLNKTISNANTTITTIATAPANTLFKGIAFTPGTDASTIAHVVLPVKLSSFTGKGVLNGVQLSWTTESEKNNAHFEILRADESKFFNKIGQVKGTGNSDASINYSFLDRNPLNGTNYYKLNQVDNDGKSEEFGPVAVSMNGKTMSLSVYANKESGIINLNVNANIEEQAAVKIFDISGKLVLEQNISLQNGNNDYKLSLSNATSGVHIITLTANGLNLTQKFIFQ